VLAGRVSEGRVDPIRASLRLLHELNVTTAQLLVGGPTGVLLPGILKRAHFKILARYVDQQIVAGAVARLGNGVVEVSNVFAVPGTLSTGLRA
jgi:hypothetical protein